MKRDMDLARKILIEVENFPHMGWPIVVKIEGYTKDQISYHTKLLTDAGLIESKDLSDSSGTEIFPSSLTWEGHEFLDAARSDTTWKKAKDRIISSSGTITLETLKVVLKQIITGSL